MGVRDVLRGEMLMWRRWGTWAAAVLIIIVPVLYCTIFLGSFMDPYGNVSKLPAGIVDLDQGAGESRRAAVADREHRWRPTTAQYGEGRFQIRGRV